MSTFENPCFNIAVYYISIYSVCNSSLSFCKPITTSSYMAVSFTRNVRGVGLPLPCLSKTITYQVYSTIFPTNKEFKEVGQDTVRRS